MMRRRMIEKLCDGITNLVETGPIQIAKSDPLFCFALRGLNAAHLLVKILPNLAVKNYAIDPCPKLGVYFRGKFVLPPKIEREIGVQVREDDIRQLIHTRTF